MKRFLSLVLSLAMILPIMLAATPALAEENPYAEHLTFKVFTIDGSDDMFNWPLVKQAMEKFNFDFESSLSRGILGMNPPARWHTPRVCRKSSRGTT